MNNRRMEGPLGKNTAAVWIRKAYKHYTSKGNRAVILNGLNMTVPKGCIYGLLGASGCGKTTLLNCIVNRKKIDSGKILVFGAIPGSKESGIPGPQIGYMPQELALMHAFTIGEAIKYFAWIAGFSHEKIEPKTNFLIKLLGLPHKDSVIRNLSGGQQRRTSLACTLVHEPELLMLDEPTVGIDSILRKNIWDHLIEISKQSTTIIITTHYIEETRQANIVGLMRGGCFLTEDSPDNVMARFNVDTLEKVFLKLSILQNSDCEINSERFVLDDVDSPSFEIPQRVLTQQHRFNMKKNLQKSRMQALLWKNFKWILRNLDSVLFFIFIGVFQISLLCWAIGHNPQQINVAIVNHETNNLKCNYSSLSCNTKHLSCAYLQYLEKNALKLVYYRSEQAAIQSVLKRKMFASIIIKPNYSIALRNRIKKWSFSSSLDYEQSEIIIYRDSIELGISNYIQLYLYQYYQIFIQDFLESCGMNKNFLTLPVRIEKPIYGSAIANFTDYFIPGFIISLNFFMSISLMAFYLIIDRKAGDMERIITVGVNLSEIISAHVLSQSVMMILQTFSILICAFYIFDLTQNGSTALVITLNLLTGLCGMAYGILIAAVCETEMAATFMSVGSIFPAILIGGTLWPTQSMHFTLRWISTIIPITKATESFRCILQRGWGLEHPDVYNGFISLLIWMALFLVVSVIYLRLFH